MIIQLLFCCVLVTQISVEESIKAESKPYQAPLGSVDTKTCTQLKFASLASKRKTLDAGQVNRVKGWLTEFNVTGIELGDAPKDAWDKKYNHFLLKKCDLDFAAIEPGLLLLHISGRLDSRNDSNKSVPILFQYADDGKFTANKGRVAKEDDSDGKRYFEVYAKRLKGAKLAMLVFVAKDRTFVMYKDATTGKERDQFYTAKIDESSLIGLKKDGPK